MRFYVDSEKLAELAQSRYKANRQLVQKFRKKKIIGLDKMVHGWDREIFAQIDCLKCANCCRTLGPRLTETDIGRLAKYLKLSNSDFVRNYLRIDEDNDFVFQSMPCPFLMANNYCSVYENRPKACRDYPHTHQPKFQKTMKISLENTKTCIVVYEIFKRLSEKYG